MTFRMIPIKRTVRAVILAVFWVLSATPYSFAQQGYYDYYADPDIPKEEKEQRESPFTEGYVNGMTHSMPPNVSSDPYSSTDGIQESDVAPPELQKRLVETPTVLERPQIDASDPRPPSALLRARQLSEETLLEPGVTVDGLRFRSFNDSPKFVENYYRNSNFRMEDVFGRVINQETQENCLTCHQGIEEISNNHPMKCVQCHEGNPRSRTLSGAHRNLVANPSDLEHAAKYCGKCHADHIEQVRSSSMARAGKIINSTRYAWGAQLPHESQFSVTPNAERNEFPVPEGEHPVDDFLRTKCLRCHLQSPSPNRPGDYRATGCASCHMVYSNDGLTLTRDRAIQSVQRKERKKNKNRFSRNYAGNALKNQRGYPVLHKFTVAIPSVQCEHCHNGNGVGDEFEGLFARPAERVPAMKHVVGEQPVLHGQSHDFLLQDIHREKGMHCIDCHGVEEIKADEHLNTAGIRCEDCHGTVDAEPMGEPLSPKNPEFKAILEKQELNPNLARKFKKGGTFLVTQNGVRLTHVQQVKDQWILTSKVTGKKHVIPTLATKDLPIAHRIAGHMQNIECHTCHARWSANEWGTRVTLSEEVNPDWRQWTVSDPSLKDVLVSGNDEEGPSMLDWLGARFSNTGIEGPRIPDIWWSHTVKSDWTSMILGKNGRNKYSVFKPRYQYFVSDETTESPGSAGGNPMLTLDAKPGLLMTPHTPHTIRKTVRSCESCHENNLAVGLGESHLESVTNAQDLLLELNTNNRVPPEWQHKQMVTANGDPLQATLPGENIRFLNAEEIARLQQPSELYKTYRYMDLRQEGFARLLSRRGFPYDDRHMKNESLLGEPPAEDRFLETVPDSDIVTETPSPESNNHSNGFNAFIDSFQNP